MVRTSMVRTLSLGSLAALALALLVLPFALHCAQQRHDRLPFDVAAAEAGPSGELFASTMRSLVDRELSTWAGWRPNDFFLWGPQLWADNNASRQLGIIQAVRESMRVFRDNLTKVSATGYDPHLVEADTRFRNDERKFWFPSAENSFEAGIAALDAYIAGLRGASPTSKPINRRNVELIRLFTTWTDLLGSAHADLYADDVGLFETDDQFYHAQGVAHVIHHLTLAIRREYEPELRERVTVLQLVDEVAASLGRAALLKPLMILDGDADGLFANHRRNLDAFLVDARQKMYSIREELEK
jgi:hypothetical protein